MSENAQEVFARLMRDVVAPELRRQGHKGSGSVYLLPDAAYWAQVGFQKSMSSDRDRVKFTINLKVSEKAWWDEQRRDHSPVKDTPPSGIDRASWDARRLERSAYPARPSASSFGDGRTERIGHGKRCAIASISLHRNMRHGWPPVSSRLPPVAMTALSSSRRPFAAYPGMIRTNIRSVTISSITLATT